MFVEIAYGDLKSEACIEEHMETSSLVNATDFSWILGYVVFQFPMKLSA